MKKRRFPLPAIVGISLIVIGLGLVITLQIRMHIGTVQRQEILASMEELWPDRSAGIPGTDLGSHMPVLEIEGEDYVAMLQIPALNVTLPVADTWDNGKLYRSPARFYGSAYDNTLVVGGADDSRQFSFCDKIDNGTVITITDMIGTQFSYAVSRVDRARKAESQWLMDTDHDLTLFCWDYLSMEYVAVRCDFVYQNSLEAP